MRIGIDIRNLIFSRAGISQYTKNLIKNLAAIDRQNEYVLLCNTMSRCDWSAFRNFREQVIRLPNVGRLSEQFWEEILLPRALRPFDLFHSTRFMLPKKKVCAYVDTIHDLTFRKFPGIFTRQTRAYVNEWVERAVTSADRIIVDSRNTKQDLIELYNAQDEKVDVIYVGVDESFRPNASAESVREIRTRYNLPEKFVLFVGTIEPRKNLKSLVEAFSLFLERASSDHYLVIAGGKGWQYEDIFSAVVSLGLNKRVVFPGYIPDTDLPLLYNAADVFVYPSLYEGFGLPVLEAMACGVPVITSNVSSLPEVAGDAAILIEPSDIQAIARAMEKVIRDTEVKQDMIEAGLRRAKMFSWETMAQETLKVYSSI